MYICVVKHMDWSHIWMLMDIACIYTKASQKQCSWPKHTYPYTHTLNTTSPSNHMRSPGKENGILICSYDWNWFMCVRKWKRPSERESRRFYLDILDKRAINIYIYVLYAVCCGLYVGCGSLVHKCMDRYYCISTVCMCNMI